MSAPNILLPVLQSLKDGEAHSLDYIKRVIDEHIEYSDSVFKSAMKDKIEMNISTALGHLARAGLIENQSEDSFRITSFGKMILDKRLNQLDLEFLKRLPGYDQ